MIATISLNTFDDVAINTELNNRLSAIKNKLDITTDINELNGTVEYSFEPKKGMNTFIDFQWFMSNIPGFNVTGMSFSVEVSKIILDKSCPVEWANSIISIYEAQQTGEEEIILYDENGEQIGTEMQSIYEEVFIEDRQKTIGEYFQYTLGQTKAIVNLVAQNKDEYGNCRDCSEIDLTKLLELMTILEAANILVSAEVAELRQTEEYKTI